MILKVVNVDESVVDTVVVVGVGSVVFVVGNVEVEFVSFCPIAVVAKRERIHNHIR